MVLGTKMLTLLPGRSTHAYALAEVPTIAKQKVGLIGIHKYVIV